MKKSYWLKTRNGNVASVTMEGKKPSKKTVESLEKIIDLAFIQLKKEKKC